MARSTSIVLLVAALLSTAAIAAADTKEGLIAWYPFDKGVVDRTGNIEQIEGESILPIITGKFGGAVKLDGDTIVGLPIDLGPDLIPSITISLWVKTDPRPADAELEKSLPNSAYVVSQSIAVGNLKSDSPYFYGEALGRAIVGGKHTTRRGQWQHVAVVRTIEDRPNTSGEIEPHVVSQFHSGGRISELVVPFRGQSMATDLYLGAASPRHPQKSRFRGAVDELRIFDRALSKEEVGLLAKAGSGKPSFGVEREMSPGAVPEPPVAGISPLGGPSGVNPAVLPDSADNVSLPTYDDNRDAAAPVTPLPTAGGSPSVMLPNENLDDFQDRMDDPEFKDSLKVVDWNLKGMIPLTQEERANIYPGATITIKVRVAKDDRANSIPRANLVLGDQPAIPIELATSDKNPAREMVLPISITIPTGFVFAENSTFGSYYVEAKLVSDEGSPLQDNVANNNSRRLSIGVRKEPAKDDLALSSLYVDNSVLINTDLPYATAHENDYRTTLIFEDTGEYLVEMVIHEQNDKPCEGLIGGHQGSGREFLYCEGPAEVSLSGAGPSKDTLFIQVPSPQHAITGIRVCRNSTNNRLKGIGIEYRRIKSDGKLELASNYFAYELPNCAKWTQLHRCQGGAVAAGVELMLNSGSALAPRDFVHSINLLCGELKLKEET